MLEQAEIEPGMRVLEVGASGYNAALIHRARRRWREGHLGRYRRGDRRVRPRLPGGCSRLR
ncbi:MAG: hypothetical protein ACRDTG_27590 [Pseudonocardiaceae bacterium]